MASPHKYLSKVAIALSLIVFVVVRIGYTSHSNRSLKVTTWDALGYYIYLPSTIIYEDIKTLEWTGEIENFNELSGGKLYQANKNEKGDYVFKYLGGISLMQLPFFLLAHGFAILSDHPANGFSLPYQIGIVISVFFYFLIGLLLLRKSLLTFFSDKATFISILAITLTSNLIQYVTIDSGMSHGYIFALYCLVIWATICWHKKPRKIWAIIIGGTIGLAAISRPTEAIMLLVPLLWNTNTSMASKIKWNQVKTNKSSILWAILAGTFAILPQIIYWKIASSDWIYNMGSKWQFFDPFFRVLFGYQNGWFIYTPIAFFFLLGFFYSRKHSFFWSSIITSVLTIWIVISWSDWRYGATYSCRALVQSIPLFAFPFTAFINHCINFKYHLWIYVLLIYLTSVNFIQVYQYNERIIHPHDMNAKYFWAIYADPSPSPMDMSLLDMEKTITSPASYESVMMLDTSNVGINAPRLEPSWVLDRTLTESVNPKWFQVDAEILLQKGFSNCFLNLELYAEDTIIYNRIRIENPISKQNQLNKYAFTTENRSKQIHTVRAYVGGSDSIYGRVKSLSLTAYFNREQK